MKLRLGDVIEQNKTYNLRVLGRSQSGGARGDRFRLVPLSPTPARRPRRHAESQRPHDATTDRLFVARRRGDRTGDHEALTASGQSEPADALLAAGHVKPTEDGLQGRVAGPLGIDAENRNRQIERLVGACRQLILQRCRSLGISMTMMARAVARAGLAALNGQRTVALGGGSCRER